MSKPFRVRRMNSRNNILLIGAGQYGRSCYVKHFLQHTYPDARLALIVDLEKERANIMEYVAQFPEDSRPECMFLPAPLNSSQLTVFLSMLRDRFDSVILSTPPEDRMDYFRVLLHMGVNILCDKPLTAPKDISVNPRTCDLFVGEYQDICQMYRRAQADRPDIRFDVMVQRRYHPVFQLIQRKLMEVAAYTGCPLTHFQATHADGQWRTPQEMMDIGYHGFNIGQGKASHSGYHFFDITSLMVESSFKAAGRANELDEVEAYSVPSFPKDNFRVMTNAVHAKTLKGYQPVDASLFRQASQNYGEVDCTVSLNFKSRGDSMVGGNLNLLHNSFSGRYWNEPNMADLYRANGRLRQELHYYVQGPFQSISVVSLRGCSKVPVSKRLEEDSAKEPLEIHVFRNTGINRAWRAYERFTIGDLIPSLEIPDAHLAFARNRCIEQFVLRQGNVSNLLSHANSVNVMAASCESIATKSVARRAFTV
jgi:hypothetical protein